MKKLLITLVFCMVGLFVFADNVQQCKMNSTSYVVASQKLDGGIVTLKGYGQCANCTVVLTFKNIDGEIQTKTADIENGQGVCDKGGLRANAKLIKVDNIVCFAN